MVLHCGSAGYASIPEAPTISTLHVKATTQKQFYKYILEGKSHGKINRVTFVALPFEDQKGCQLANMTYNSHYRSEKFYVLQVGRVRDPDM